MTQIAYTTPPKNGLQLVQTDFYGLGGEGSLISSVQFIWDNTFAGTITIWACNLPERLVPTNDAVANNKWTQLNPPTGYTAITGGTASAATPLVLAVTTGVAGNAFMDIGNSGAVRLRAQVVCTTQGQLLIWPNGKS